VLEQIDGRCATRRQSGCGIAQVRSHRTLLVYFAGLPAGRGLRWCSDNVRVNKSRFRPPQGVASSHHRSTHWPWLGAQVIWAGF
jgi:hypothetical protein